MAVPGRGQAIEEDRVGEFLAVVRRRIRWAWLVAAAQRWAPAASGTALVLVVASRLVPWPWLELAALLVGAGTVAALMARCFTLPVSEEAAARSADRALATNDALSTSLQFAGLADVFGDGIRTRAGAAARRGDAGVAIPMRVRWRPLLAVVAASLAAVGVALFIDPASRAVSSRDIERAALAEEAEGLRARAEELAGSSLASSDQAAQAEQLQQLVEELEQATDLEAGLAALEQARSELEASVSDYFLAEKSAVQGLNRSLEARPLAEGQGGAAAQLEALGEALSGLSDGERAALAERLDALSATQTAGNPVAAGALGAAGEALASGDLGRASAALGEAAAAQRAGEASLSDQTALVNTADLLADASARLASLGGQGQGQGQGQGAGQGQGQGQGQGAGNPSGSVTGASGGTSQGRGGQGTASGSGDSTVTGDSGAPTVWVPGGATDEQRVGGTSTSDQSSIVGQGQALTGTTGARVPVDTVLSDYLDEAVESLDRGRIPPASRALVQRYFDIVAGF